MTSSQPGGLPDDNPAAPRSIERKIGSVLLGICVPVPRGKTSRSKAWWIGRRIALLYLIILFIFAFFQRDLIYQPSRADAIDPRLSGLEPRRIEAVRVPTADGLQLNGWLVRVVPNAARRTAERFSSSRRHLVSRQRGASWISGSELDQLSRLGADAYLVDYRGYGDNPGRPTEENLEADARAVWKFVTTSQHVQPSQVVLLGESLGGRRGHAPRLGTLAGRHSARRADLVRDLFRAGRRRVISVPLATGEDDSDRSLSVRGVDRARHVPGARAALQSRRHRAVRIGETTVRRGSRGLSRFRP